jgi:hypothetical protein
VVARPLGNDDGDTQISFCSLSRPAAITDLPVASYLPRNRIRVQIYLDDRARACRKDRPDRQWVGHVHEEIIASDPDAIIISNKADEYGITPNKAKGLNDYIGRKIYYVMMFPAPDQYRGLLVENAVFGRDDSVKLHLLDEFDQIVGRILGFATDLALRSSSSCRPGFGVRSV